MRNISVKTQIEATSQISELEAHWWKNPREKLIEAMITRSPDSVTPDYKKSGKMDIHTHPRYIKPSLPSFQDLFAFNYKVSRLMIIAAINSRGEVMGYTFVNKHPQKNQQKRLVSDWEFEEKRRYCEKITNSLREIIKKISELRRLAPTDETAKQISDLFKEWERLGTELTKITYTQIEKTGWRMRLVPMKGYKFQYGYFVPKPPPPGSGGSQIIQPTPQTDLDRQREEKKRMELERIRRLNQKQRITNKGG